MGITLNGMHKKHHLPPVFPIAGSPESAHTSTVRKMSSGFSPVYRCWSSRGGSTGTSGPLPNLRRLSGVSIYPSGCVGSICSLPRETDAVFGGDDVSSAGGTRECARCRAQRTLADLCPGCAFDRCGYTASFVRTEPGRLQEALGVPIQRCAVAVSQDCCP